MDCHMSSSEAALELQDSSVDPPARSDSGSLCSMPMLLLYGWGQSGHGQLGLGGIEADFVTTPKCVRLLTGKNLVQVSCGMQHTVMLADDSTMYSCGSNAHGQLGHDKGCSKPESFGTFELQDLRQIASGGQHSLAVNSNGQVYSWGDNSAGQLGRGQGDYDFQKLPRLIKGFQQAVITQVACGNSHCLALSREGAVYTWGSNFYGQLGLGNVAGNRDNPQIVSSLRSLAMSQIQAGGNHSFCLTVSGALFGWGKNSFGQLGVGDEAERRHPVLCKTLRSQMVKYVACGDDHTATLTQDGGLFTFGAGSYGQLGHGTFNHEVLPKKVVELMGSIVTQVACGRQHTMVFVATSGRVFAFGLGSCGQLGLGRDLAKHASPTEVRGPWLLTSYAERMSQIRQDGCDWKPSSVVSITCGGDASFALVCEPQGSIQSRDYRSMGECTCAVAVLSDNEMRRYAAFPAEFSLPQPLINEITIMFSMQSAWNGAFLMSNGDHYKCSSQNHGIDLDSARDAFERLGKNQNAQLANLITQAINQALLPSLECSPVDVEAMRIYLILPFVHLFKDARNFAKIQKPFADIVLRLVPNAMRILEKWWTLIPVRHFKYQMLLYKSCFVSLLNGTVMQTAHSAVNNDSFLLVLNLLKMFHEVNKTRPADKQIHYQEFCVPEVFDHVNIREDYVYWLNAGAESKPNALSFCNYPFVFDAQAKTILLHTDALMQMQQAIEEVQRTRLISLFSGAIAIGNIDPMHPCLVLRVCRANILHDTMTELRTKKSHDFKKPLKVQFVGEEAVDEGGVRKEFFMLLLRELLDPKYGMFAYHEETRLLWFSPSTFETSEMFFVIGLLCGLAIYNSVLIDLPFPLALYKKLLKKPVSLDDIWEIEPNVGRSLQELLNYEGEDVAAVFSLTFEVSREAFGAVIVDELIPDGKNITVTEHNRQEYINAYVDYTFNSSVREPFEAFYKGFHTVCGGRVLELFQPLELQAMVIGNENYDWAQLEKGCEYKGEYFSNHKTIRFFWEVFHDLPTEKKKKFLLFLTGSDRIPILGMKSFKILIQPCNVDEEHYPVAHTCFNLLDLPKYSSVEKLREKLLAAIEQTQGFGLV